MPDDSKRACLIYSPAAIDRLPGVRAALVDQGYEVCEVEATPTDGALAAAGDHPLPQALLDCISAAALCVFLLPENEADDGCLAGGAGAAEVGGKPMVGVYVGQRSVYPQVLDEHAESMVRAEGRHLIEAVSGVPIWEAPDGKRAPDREIVRVRCQ